MLVFVETSAVYCCLLYMRKHSYINPILFLAILISGCATGLVEDYVDYFYANADESGNKGFTYILSVKGAGEEQGNKNIALLEEKKRQSSRRPQPESNVPISFRMEEEAFARLDLILAKQQYCSGKIEYTKKEYTWLRYTIIGICKP